MRGNMYQKTQVKVQEQHPWNEPIRRSAAWLWSLHGIIKHIRPPRQVSKHESNVTRTIYFVHIFIYSGKSCCCLKVYLIFEWPMKQSGSVRILKPVKNHSRKFSWDPARSYNITRLCPGARGTPMEPAQMRHGPVLKLGNVGIAMS